MARGGASPIRRGRRGLWHHGDFLLLWSAQGISAVGSRVTRTALPMAAILVIGANAYELGLLAVAISLPGVLVAWFAGGWVDRHRRRPLLIATDLIRAAALLVIPAAAMLGSLTLPVLYAVAAVTGICTMLFEVADHVFITDLVSRKRLLDANGKREAADAVAEISGPALGGALVAWLTAPLAIAADAASFVLSAVLISGIRKQETILAPLASASVVDDAKTGIRVIRQAPAIRALFAAMVAFTLCGSFMAALYTLFALRELGLTPTELGIAIGCGGIGALLGASISPRVVRRHGLRWTLIGSLVVTALMQLLIPLAPPVPWIAMACLIGAQVIGDGAMTVYLVNETTLRQRLLPPEALGRAAATWKVATGLLTPAGALLGALLAETIGMRPTLVLLAVGFGIGACILVVARRALPDDRIAMAASPSTPS
ncbi:MAG: MFS transporter [Casimicrobiaceae bacterium]